MTDTAHFTQLCRTWWDVVRRAAFRVLESDDDAQDAAQQVFVRLWKSGGWRHIHRPARFFREAGRREALSILSRRPTTVRYSEGSFDQIGPAVPIPIEATALHADRLRKALRVIATLPPRCGLVFTLVALEGLTHAETARHLGISVKAVEKQVARARRKLGLLGEDGAVSPFLDGGGRGKSSSL